MCNMNWKLKHYAALVMIGYSNKGLLKKGVQVEELNILQTITHLMT
jgi:hypothetical protein